MTTTNGSDKLKVQLQEIPLEKIVNNEGQIPGLPQNPRTITKKQFDKLVKSIQEDPEMLDLKELWVYLYDGMYVVIAGNMRLRALQQLKHKTALCKVIPPTTPDKLKRFAIKDNIAFGDYDWDILANEWEKEELEQWGLPVGEWKEPSGLKDGYSQKLGEVIYEPKETNHKIKDLFVVEKKFDADIEAIKNPELKEMLRLRAANFVQFNYEKVADYYAYQATPEEQRIMERLALVLLDKDQLIENGFSKLIEKVDDTEEEYENPIE